MNPTDQATMLAAFDCLGRSRALLMQPKVTLTDLRLAVTHAQNATAKLNLLAGILEGQEQPKVGEGR